MVIKFIAHAGFAVIEENYSLLIDPWFTDSSLENPIVEGISGARTIDFQMPKTKENIRSFTPNGVFLSHLHVHHSPKKDILDLLRQTPHEVMLAFPDSATNSFVEKAVIEHTNVVLRPLKDRTQSDVGPFTITALSHTAENHLAWSIRTKNSHILHIADARANALAKYNELDPAWEKFFNLKPDIVFISTGRNSLKKEISGQRIILENTILSPIQAARLISKIKPKAVSCIGTFNHSIWKNNTEYIPDTSSSEDEFRWALDWLAPEIKFIPIRPGHAFQVNEPHNKTEWFHTYL